MNAALTEAIEGARARLSLDAAMGGNLKELLLVETCGRELSLPGSARITVTDSVPRCENCRLEPATLVTMDSVRAVWAVLYDDAFAYQLIPDSNHYDLVKELLWHDLLTRRPVYSHPDNAYGRSTQNQRIQHLWQHTMSGGLHGQTAARAAKVLGDTPTTTQMWRVLNKSALWRPWTWWNPRTWGPR